VIKDIKNLHAQLRVEIFRDELHVVVLEQGRIEID